MATDSSARIQLEELRSLHGAALTKLLERSGLTQVALGRRARISRKQINQYLGGKKIPLVKNLAKVLNALDATLLDYAAALHAAARESTLSSTDREAWIAQPGTPRASQVTGGDSSYGDENTHLYLLQGIPREQVLIFEAGSPERVLSALRDVLGRRQ